MRICVFGYDFPHAKTQDFILHLIAIGIKPSLVVLAPKVDIKKTNKVVDVNMKLDQARVVEPRRLCDHLGVSYQVSPHNSQETIKKLSEENFEVGLIAGARILAESIIDQFSVGILNIHPGKLPEVRGLDSSLWSILLDIDLCVTAHFINDKIDEGSILQEKKIVLQIDDSIASINYKMYDAQLALLPSIMKKIESKNYDTKTNNNFALGKLRTSMSVKNQQEVVNKLQVYLSERVSKVQ